jgi:DNA-directed RNA polymerase subunit RPC12/RpoP
MCDVIDIYHCVNCNAIFGGTEVQIKNVETITDDLNAFIIIKEVRCPKCGAWSQVPEDEPEIILLLEI